MVAALAAKYTSPADRQYLPDADQAFDVVYAVRPQSAMTWRLPDYEASQRRWTSGSGPATGFDLRDVRNGGHHVLGRGLGENKGPGTPVFLSIFRSRPFNKHIEIRRFFVVFPRRRLQPFWRPICRTSRRGAGRAALAPGDVPGVIAT